MPYTEIPKSLTRVLAERIGSPFYGTFFVTWTIWNWKIPVALFSGNASPSERIDLIAEKLKDADKLLIYYVPIPLDIFILPFLYTLLLIILVPHFTIYLLGVSRRLDLKALNTKAKYDKEAPLMPEEANYLRTQIAQLRTENKKLIGEKDSDDKRVLSLENIVSQLRKENLKIKGEYNKILNQEKLKANQNQDSEPNSENNQPERNIIQPLQPSYPFSIPPKLGEISEKTFQKIRLEFDKVYNEIGNSGLNKHEIYGLMRIPVNLATQSVLNRPPIGA